MHRWAVCLLVSWLSVSCACREEKAAAPAAGGNTSSLQVPRSGAAAEEAARQRQEAVDKSLNPSGLPPYSGPVGAVTGVVTIAGDAAPILSEMAAQLPAQGCPRAHELQRKLFREGVNRTLADVLITVTEYKGYLKPKTDAVRLDIRGCAFDAKVIAAVYGQRLDVYNHDGQAYMPRLVGTPSYALRVAMPGGNPVPIFPPRAGRYLLIDETREYMQSELYVLNYPTHDVTGLDGEFEIGGIPSGEVKVTAYAPLIGAVKEQRVQIQAGITRRVAFELSFSQADYEAARAKAAEAQRAVRAGDGG